MVLLPSCEGKAKSTAAVRLEHIGVDKGMQLIEPAVPLVNTSRASAVVVGHKPLAVPDLPEGVQRALHLLGDSVAVVQ
jgi:hypothetical protein